MPFTSIQLYWFYLLFQVFSQIANKSLRIKPVLVDLWKPVLFSHYKETTEKKKLQTLDEVVEDTERDELEALAKKFEAKYVSMNSAKIIFLALSC